MTDVAERRAKLAEQEATNARLFAEEIAAARAKAEAALSEHGEVTVRLYGHVWQVVCGKRSVADEGAIDGAIQQHLDIIARKAKPITHERPMPADPEPEAPKPPEPPPEVVKNAPEPEPVVESEPEPVVVAEEEAMPLPPNPVEAKLSQFGPVGEFAKLPDLPGPSPINTWLDEQRAEGETTEAARARLTERFRQEINSMNNRQLRGERLNEFDREKLETLRKQYDELAKKGDGN